MMETTNLSTQELTALIEMYQSSLRKLQYQAAKVEDTIAELQIIRRKRRDPNYVPPASKKKASELTAEGHMFTSFEETSSEMLVPAPRRNKRRKPKEDDGRFRLSEWDKELIQLIEENERPMSTSELMNFTRQRILENGEELNERRARAKLSRILNKLIDRHCMLKRHPIRGKGFAYGLVDWFEGKELRTSVRTKMLESGITPT